MKKMFKKSIAMLIAVLMVISTMPFTALTAFAADSTEKAYVKANIASFNGYNGTAKYTYNGTDLSSQYSDYYSNIVYDDGTFTDSDYVTANDVKGKIFINSNVVLMYDGVNDTILPVVLSIGSNDKYRCADFVDYRADSNWTFKEEWKGKSTSDWSAWPTASDATIRITYDSNSSLFLNKNTYYMRNKLYYNGTGDTSKYYDDYSQSNNQIKINMSHHSNYFTDNKTVRYTDITDKDANIYVINYKPIKDAISKMKTVYNTIQSNGEDKYCDDYLESFYQAAYQIMTFNPNSYSYSTGVETQVKNCANKIADLVSNAIPTATTEPTKHTEETIPAVAATCTTTGLTEGKKCSHCGEILVAQQTVAIDPDAHKASSQGVKVNIKPATCNTAETYDVVIYCELCHKEMSRTQITGDPATGNHSYGSAQQYSETQHKYVCSVCGDEKFEDHNIVNGKCTVCGYSALNMDAYNAAHNEAVLTMAETDKYTSDSMAAYKTAVVAASDKINSATTQAEVDAITSEIISAKTLLAKATVTVKFVVNNDDTDTSTTVTKTAAWGESVHLDTESNYVSKWTISVNGTTSNMATTASAIDHVATEDATITAYVSNDESDSVKYSKVTFIGKNSAVVGIKYVAAGTTVATNTLLTAPVIPFYEDGQWDKAEIVADGSDITVRATYVPKAVDENKCGIHFNGETKYYNYDSYVYLFSADKSKKYAMYADEAGTELITYFDGVDFYAPRRDNLYIKEVADTSAMTASIGFTGSYKQDATSASFNVKFWLPEGATLVETGVDFNITFPDGRVASGHDRATKFSQRNEYTYSAKFNSNKKTIEFKPYLTYMLNGQKTTVYGISQTVEY